jgi:hypothetical protein
MLNRDLMWNGLPVSGRLRDNWIDLLSTYLASGLVAKDIKPRLASLDIGDVFAIVWEALLYRHFTGCGYRFLTPNIRASGQHGPDFCLETDTGRVWVEATTLSPSGLPSEWLAPIEPGNPVVKSVPHQAILLRWTSAVRDKHLQLLSRLSSGSIPKGDAYVIAINSARCFNGIPYDEGVSRWPYAAESVFPIGPLAVSIDPTGKTPSRTEQSVRYTVENKNKAPIVMNSFLLEEFSDIAALIGSSTYHTIDREPTLVLVHNPHAKGLIPVGFAKPIEEIYSICELDGTLTINRKRSP